jgi:hypothetical protein
MITQAKSNSQLRSRIGRITKSEMKRLGIRHLRTEEKWLGSWSYTDHKKYARQYVAIKGEQVVAADRSLAVVHRVLDEQGLRPVLIALIEDPDEAIIYAL